MADWMPPPSDPPPYSAAMPPPSTPYPGDEAVYAGDDGPPAVARPPGTDQWGLPKKGLLGGVVLLWDDRGFGFLQVPPACPAPHTHVPPPPLSQTPSPALGGGWQAGVLPQLAVHRHGCKGGGENHRRHPGVLPSLRSRPSQ